MDTPLTESVQIRIYREVPAGVTGAMGVQDFFEFELSRVLLLAAEAGGLRAVTPHETKFRIFGSHGEDVFEKNTENRPLQCVNCHAGPGVQSLGSLEALFPPHPLISDSVEGDSQFGSLYREASATLYWKETRYDWGLLKALRPLPSNLPSR